MIAATLKISADRCDSIRKMLALPRRESWHGSKTGHRKAYLPSEEEIRQKCLEFQAGWSDEERARRKNGGIVPKETPYETPVLPESVFRLQGDSDSGATFLEDLASGD